MPEFYTSVSNFPTSKICSRCNTEKSLDEFPVCKNGKFARRADCKDCNKKTSQNYRDNNREKVNAAARLRREVNKDNPEYLERKRQSDCDSYRRNREKRLAYSRNYIANNKEAVIARKKIYSQNNKEKESARKQNWLKRRGLAPIYSRRNYQRNRGKILARSRNWRYKNRDYYADHQSKRRALLRSATTNEIVKRSEVFRRDKGLCRYCGIPLGNSWHLEHVIPLSRGGLHCMTNVVASCQNCNLTKNAKTPAEAGMILLEVN